VPDRLHVRVRVRIPGYPWLAVAILGPVAFTCNLLSCTVYVQPCVWLRVRATWYLANTKSRSQVLKVEVILKGRTRSARSRTREWYRRSNREWMIPFPNPHVPPVVATAVPPIVAAIPFVAPIVAAVVAPIAEAVVAPIAESVLAPDEAPSSPIEGPVGQS
jgi:hypothetical protein